MTSDLAAASLDGAWLVQNFGNMNPSNTLWTKQYNVYSKVDTEADRYLEFERWWGGHVNLNAEEIQFIVDELFVGNNLAGRIKTSDGQVVDLRNISSPIVVFCSKGDNITPPQQALSWILDPTAMSTRSGPTGKPSSTPFTKRSGTSESSFPAAWPRKSTANSQATSI
jgi:poly(3-hydroxyalkanoate) synthetase